MIPGRAADGARRALLRYSGRAFGLLSAQIEHHAARTVLTPTRGMDLGPVQAAVDEMRGDLLARAEEEGFSVRDVTILAAVDLRYRGQSSELTVSIPSDRLTESLVREAEEDFEREYERTYGHRGTTKLFELVTVRLVARVARSVEHAQQWMAEPSLAGSGQRRAVYFGPEHGQVITPVIGRSDPTPVLPSSLGAVARLMQIPLNVEPGDYELILTVRDETTGELRELVEPFQVVRGS